MEDTKCTQRNFISNKMDVDLDMFGALMTDRVGGEIDGGNIVTINECSLAWSPSNFREQRMKPG